MAVSSYIERSLHRRKQRHFHRQYLRKQERWLAAFDRALPRIAGEHTLSELQQRVLREEVRAHWAHRASLEIARRLGDITEPEREAGEESARATLARTLFALLDDEAAQALYEDLAW
jgi:hypothetical protein